LSLSTNFAIALFESGLHSQAVAYLHAAAEEDKTTYRVNDVFKGSYALSASGIFGQWLGGILGQLPSSVDDFLRDAGIGEHDSEAVKQFCLWCAQYGDLRLPASIQEYRSTNGRTDLQSSAIRLECVRDLSSMFEVLWKRIGAQHVHPAVQAEFSEPPTLAALIYHMHYSESRASRRKNPALAANKSVGLLWNDTVKCDKLLDAIDGGMDGVLAAATLGDTWAYLAGAKLSTDVVADLVSKRYLLAYRVRNWTAHTFEPQDAGFAAHADEIFEWLLAANLHLYLWALETGQLKA